MVHLRQSLCPSSLSCFTQAPHRYVLTTQFTSTVVTDIFTSVLPHSVEVNIPGFRDSSQHTQEARVRIAVRESTLSPEAVTRKDFVFRFWSVVRSFSGRVIIVLR